VTLTPFSLFFLFDLFGCCPLGCSFLFPLRLLCFFFSSTLIGAAKLFELEFLCLLFSSKFLLFIFSAFARFLLLPGFLSGFSPSSRFVCVILVCLVAALFLLGSSLFANFGLPNLPPSLLDVIDVRRNQFIERHFDAFVDVTPINCPLHQRSCLATISGKQRGISIGLSLCELVQQGGKCIFVVLSRTQC